MECKSMRSEVHGVVTFINLSGALLLPGLPSGNEWHLLLSAKAKLPAAIRRNAVLEAHISQIFCLLREEIIPILETILPLDWVRSDTLIWEPVRDLARLLVINEGFRLTHNWEGHALVNQLIVVKDVLLRNDVVLPHELLFLLRVQCENGLLLDILRLLHLLHVEPPEILFY